MPVESTLQLLLALQIMLGYFAILILPLFNTVDCHHQMDDLRVAPLAAVAFVMTVVAVVALVV
ncbi:hypothetical protein G3N59_30720 [Paraburkholderia sp. Ac-20340]|uniref:hypothetical protein n=1 Tax=Paraburkholderia sp. Ac-20340 TaxID=2703888 RepID=UPI00197D4053|nr:hypothetical protein [Paraburkholderia sp. Ac-20340]MBN3857768.1 hypothetical protein [Paraburkholderia sp. Ac-20340]